MHAQRLPALETLSPGIFHDLGHVMAVLRGYLSKARTTLYPHPPARSRVQVAERGGPQAILFLDDDPGLVFLAQWALGRAGYNVAGYTNTSAALGAFAAAPLSYDAVVTDLWLPGADGIEVAQSIMAIRGDIPVIITAGSISPHDERRALACGVREVLEKSATIEDLRAAIDRALE